MNLDADREHLDVAAVVAAGESLTVEFKRGSVNDRQVIETVVCLANGQGGTLLLGVEDDGAITGAKHRHDTQTSPMRLAAAIQNLTEPPHAVDVSVHEVAGVEVIVIEVPQAIPGPVATKSGLFVKRAIGTDGRPTCIPMTPYEIVSLGLVSRGIDYAAAPARGASMADLDPVEFERFRRRCAATSGQESMAKLSDTDICKALGLLHHDGSLGLGAILLFGRDAALDRWVPTAEFLFQDLREGGLHANLRLRGPLLRIAEEIAALLDLRNTTTELTAGIHRVDIDLMPERTRREAVANALVHRDYAELGPTTIRLTDTQFVVSNPGGFPPGITVENMLEQSRPRSPILADAFRRVGLVERKGKGINEMFEAQLRAGREVPDYTASNPELVSVAVPLGSVDLDLVRFLLTFEDSRQRPLALDELRLVHELKAAGSATNGELAEALALPSGAVRTTSTRLVEMGVIEARGSGRNRRFHLTARFYDLAQDRNAYVRVRAMDPLQQEQLVSEYVRSYGSIARSQAAELCQLAPTEARALLKRMTDKGMLKMVGERRTARYVPTDSHHQVPAEG
ncbi:MULTISPECIES: DNA glycosylase AlkZ-like family protein [Propionibacteriales]|uniref:DNA glycosylase AlkZ-like family protein n=1 Tax=Propionibacteriales TaxID=85009 RepID=UPI002B213DEB|nr:MULTISPECIES: crosslink repair DNA glycosylase YcaQ family protein [Propionibacteriales]MEA4944089.1 crosslink repair DNA glycosylase YcaQ family protein [Propionicimonas sp.]MEA5155629.1 crosslink repair DNA glycosylase YcaQ family protein [Raineyella sp.]